jgi:hypothetical protein
MQTQDRAVEIQFNLNEANWRGGGEVPVTATRSAPGRLPRVTQVMALAIHFQDMIQRKEARDYADLARLGCITRERISQIMKLLSLAPDIQRDILEFKPTRGGRFPVSEVAVRSIVRDFSWDRQRERWAQLQKEMLGL